MLHSKIRRTSWTTQRDDGSRARMEVQPLADGRIDGSIVVKKELTESLSVL